jgi:membrane protein
MSTPNNTKVRSLSWKEIGLMVKTSFKEFFEDNSFLHGAALAYYAIFALVPIIYLALTTFGKVVGQERMIEIISNIMEVSMGIEDVSPFTDLMYQWNIGSGGSFALRAVGIGVLIFTSTAMFNSMRNSINSFFHVQPIHHYNVFLENLINRLISFGILALFGVVVILIYFGQTVLVSLSSELFSGYSATYQTILFLIEHISLLLVNFIMFAFIFKYLHDGKIRWKLALGGALFTSIMLYLGQLLVNYYLTNFFFAANSGIAGTLLMVLTWIFYTSQIIFLGAKFTSVYARFVGKPIVPK